MSGHIRGKRQILEQTLEESRRALLSAQAALPGQDALDLLLREAKDAQEAGYYTPAADERVRHHYVNYLGLRAALWQSIQTLLPYIDLPRRFKKGEWQKHLYAFAIAFTSSALLLRTGLFLVDLANEKPVVRAKLDEAEPRFGIERKQFTAIYDSLVSSRRLARYAQAVRFYDRHKAEIFDALAGQYEDVAEALRLEDQYLETRMHRLVRRHVRRKARFGLFALKRRRMSAMAKTMFFLFEATGSDIAEMKQPFVKPAGAPKRITPEIREKLLQIVKPGDVFITRHDDAMSNLFLPGFWPHAALYIGTDVERAAMGVAASNPAHQSQNGVVRFLESKKDGVLFRPAEDTLQVDCCVVLRPRLSKKDSIAALNRALSHAGKLYDFVFDFTSANRLACTELIYRSYDGFGDIHFKLGRQAGRMCLSAEDLLNQAVGNNWFEVIALFGVGDDILSQGDEAKARLLASYDYSPPK